MPVTLTAGTGWKWTTRTEGDLENEKDKRTTIRNLLCVHTVAGAL